MISVSIVSHGHENHIRRLVADLDAIERPDLEVLLTLNAPEDRALRGLSAPFPLTFLVNDMPRGFSTNHNAAFRAARGDFFCVLNPDLRLSSDPFRRLLQALEEDRVGVAAPHVLEPDGSVQATYRPVPTPGRLFRKALGFTEAVPSETAQRVYPDWIGGMFMLFRRSAFELVGGFDERYFLYYEDVDICCRLWLAGRKVCVAKDAVVVHEGQRASRRNLRYLRWHLQSIWRFFHSPVYRRFVSQPR